MDAGWGGVGRAAMRQTAAGELRGMGFLGWTVVSPAERSVENRVWKIGSASDFWFVKVLRVSEKGSFKQKCVSIDCVSI